MRPPNDKCYGALRGRARARRQQRSASFSRRAKELSADARSAATNCSRCARERERAPDEMFDFTLKSRNRRAIAAPRAAMRVGFYGVSGNYRGGSAEC